MAVINLFCSQQLKASQVKAILSQENLAYNKDGLVCGAKAASVIELKNYFLTQMKVICENMLSGNITDQSFESAEAILSALSKLESQKAEDEVCDEKANGTSGVISLFSKI